MLGHGIDVILDFGMWKRIEREDYRTRASLLGAATIVHFLDVPTDVLFRRLDIRNDLSANTVAHIPHETLSEWLEHFESPDTKELSRNGT